MLARPPHRPLVKKLPKVAPRHIGCWAFRRLGGGVRGAAGFAVGACLFVHAITRASLVVAIGMAVCEAGELRTSVIDRSGHALSEVVVTVAPLEEHVAAPAPARAVMDQRNRAFVPHVLVVAVGTSVEFPNNDTVSHQVYSFSAAKKFHLSLYKGESHPPVTFEREGLVVLGCNIHDEMAGYIYVTDAEFFGKTDTTGSLFLQNVPAGDYRVTVWSPFISDPPANLVRDVHVGAQEIAAYRVQLVQELRTRPEPRPRRGDWEY